MSGIKASLYIYGEVYTVDSGTTSCYSEVHDLTSA